MSEAVIKYRKESIRSDKLGKAQQEEETACMKAERNKPHSKLREEAVHYYQRKLKRHSWARSARILNVNLRRLSTGMGNGEPQDG